MRIRVAAIVEGHGEVSAVPVLLRRLWSDVLSAEWIDVLQPIRQPRTKLLRRTTSRATTEPAATEMERAIKLARNKLAARRTEVLSELILVLLDADTDCPKELTPRLLETARGAAGGIDVVVVLAKVEYETWFVASSGSLATYLRLGSGESRIENPEEERFGKKWIADRFRGPKYSETIDQVKLTAAMDLRVCRERSPSFDKLCRELELRGGHTINDQRVRRERPMP
jgi:hypothetical protein